MARTAQPRNEPPAAVEKVAIGVGGRVMVLANLALAPEPSAASLAASAVVARALRSWHGPGTLVVAGGLLDPAASSEGGARLALEAHGELSGAFGDFARGDGRRLIVLPGRDDSAISTDPAARKAVEALGAQVASAVDLEMTAATGTRLVRVEAGAAGGITAGEGAGGSAGARGERAGEDGAHLGSDSARNGVLSALRGAAAAASAPGESTRRPWLDGASRLADPSSLHRFLTSRLLYRRMARYCWWLLLPLAVAVLLRLPVAIGAIDHLLRNHPAPRRLIARAHAANWEDRIALAGAATLAEVLVLAGVVALLARKAWGALGGGQLRPSGTGDPSAGTTMNDEQRDSAVALVALGYAGLVSGATLQAELTHLGSPETADGAPGTAAKPAGTAGGLPPVGFFACVGAMGEIVEELPGRVGLPPVFAHRRQTGWVELETGADLHVRLLMARSEGEQPTMIERLVARTERLHDTYPSVVASLPAGASWPPAPDLSTLKRRSRRVRRLAASAIAVAGAVDLLGALTPPLRSHLRLVDQVLPLGASQAAGALVALAGLALLALARGVRRGQRRAWGIAVVLLSSSVVLHAARGGDLVGTLVALAVLALLVVRRDEFTAGSDRQSSRAAAFTLAGGTLGATALATAIVELSVHVHQGRRVTSLGTLQAAEAVLGRLVGIHTIALPDRLDDFLSPSLLAIGLTLASTVLLLATRPVVDRRRASGRFAEIRARDIVRRHGAGTLDYFALRGDKRWFFHRDTLVAYAIYGGVCLVSPDPIGPASERAHAWGAFRRFADGNSWVVALMGASEEWLPLYRTTGMHDIYIGDEAVVDVRKFSLTGGHMKGLRQAHNRIARYGYTASFHDPAHLDPGLAAELRSLMRSSRRGEAERGFSMMLGRIFDTRDEGLVLTVVKAPDGLPVAMCQFVPAPGIGGYSLDLMRRHLGDHPNGLVDFALVSTIEHLRDSGARGLSLNFAAMRSLLDGERGDGAAQRVERWAIRKMSGFLQIESLWKFNAKYEPDWLPRYIVYDAAEHFVPVVLAILRAESLSEVPVIGRLLSPPAHTDPGGTEGGLDPGPRSRGQAV